MAPMGIGRAGYYGYNNGNLVYQLSFGYYWARRIYSSINSYVLAFVSGYALDNSPRGYGFLLRCLGR